MENETKNLHETLSSRAEVTPASPINPLFEDAQRIEGGGTPKKIVWNTLPTGIRVIGYIITALVIGMLLFALSTNYL
ncbi:hypothetical protein BK133_28245 [Paenibacillus sp. FSL H8-0548]|uniref:hypothetical protein n=1 Tax=Paenibacillus sp. FSL H8-0548 TaxID=1920422 RepID=UPI00096E35F4|nr:hypothetical protein [Paenibacillus sp. FSL H8-0548]OMF21460.1 hypothetical protein BK133_28245 [Paenibacillus sp. FSL H8-0548]